MDRLDAAKMAGSTSAETEGKCGYCPACGCPAVRWLRVATVAKQFGCSAKLVRRLLCEGQLDGVHLGNEWRVDHLSLDAYVRRESAG